MNDNNQSNYNMNSYNSMPNNQPTEFNTSNVSNNKEPKKSNSIVILLVIVVLALVGYIVYDKVIKPKTTDPNPNSGEVNNGQNTNNQSNDNNNTNNQSNNNTNNQSNTSNNNQSSTSTKVDINKDEVTKLKVYTTSSNGKKYTLLLTESNATTGLFTIVKSEKLETDHFFGSYSISNGKIQFEMLKRDESNVNTAEDIFDRFGVKLTDKIINENEEKVCSASIDENSVKIGSMTFKREDTSLESIDPNQNPVVNNYVSFDSKNTSHKYRFNLVLTETNATSGFFTIVESEPLEMEVIEGFYEIKDGKIKFTINQNLGESEKNTVTAVFDYMGALFDQDKGYQTSYNKDTIKIGNKELKRI